MAFFFFDPFWKPLVGRQKGGFKRCLGVEGMGFPGGDHHAYTEKGDWVSHHGESGGFL